MVGGGLLEVVFFDLFLTWSVLRPSVGSTNSAKSSTRRAVRSGEERERERERERQRKNFYMLVLVRDP
jgi:hypothetical protein